MKQNFDCSGDCSKCGDGRFIPPPEPGSRIVQCIYCKNGYRVSAGQRGKCPVCGHEEPAPFEIVLPTRQTTPKDELERAQKNIRRAKGLDEPKALTVGDLSVVEAKKNLPENVKQRLRDLKEGLSIGDLSIATAKKDGKGLNALFVGRHPVVKAFVSESEEIKMDMMKKRRKQIDEMFYIQNLMATGQDLRLEEYADKYLKLNESAGSKH